MSTLDNELETCDVCIVGAGIAGLNALFVASRYLSRDQRIVLIDRRRRVGGMWVDTYPYVRLHQPHGAFTAGNVPWTLGREPEYLATKDEVLDHLQHCLEVVGRSVTVVERFGWDAESHEEVDGRVRVSCRSQEGRSVTIVTDRLINAYGLGIRPNDPLQVSSAQVHSVSPDFCDVRSGEMAASDAPVWVIGGGKTAMDTAHALVTRYPGRSVNLVAGSGTFFGRRDLFFPPGSRKWWDGVLLSQIARQAALRFDGTNEGEVTEWYRPKFGTFCTPTAHNYLYGVLSESEKATITAGLDSTVMDHLVDAVDRDGAPELVFRTGATRAVPPGSWLVNCTGYLAPLEQPYEPFVSDSGSVSSINIRSATMHLPAYEGYFATHLMFLDALRDAGLYELDIQEMLKTAKAALPFAMLALAQHNLSIVADLVPTKVFKECGIDFDLWFPLPRRLVATARFLASHRRERDHHRRTLDTLRERFDVRCGPLPGSTSRPSASAGRR